MSASFPRLGKFQSSFIQVIFLPFFSLLSFWHSYNMNGRHLMLPQSSLCYLHLFTTLIWWVLLSCLWVHSSLLLFHLIFCWIPLMYFPVQLPYSSALWLLFGIFKIFSNLFDKVLTVFIHSSSEFREHFYDYHFELFIRLITYLYCFFFFCSFILLIWNMLLCFFTLFDFLSVSMH